MKTRTTVLLTALASFTLFTLFAYCTKDTPNPQENGGNGGGNTQTTLDLEGTTWKTPINGVTVHVYFTSANSGNYSYTGEGAVTESFTYSLNGLHGAIFGNMGTTLLGEIPINTTIIIVDNNTIGIGGYAFTRQ